MSFRNLVGHLKTTHPKVGKIPYPMSQIDRQPLIAAHIDQITRYHISGRGVMVQLPGVIDPVYLLVDQYDHKQTMVFLTRDTNLPIKLRIQIRNK